MLSKDFTFQNYSSIGLIYPVYYREVYHRSNFQKCFLSVIDDHWPYFIVDSYNIDPPVVLLKHTSFNVAGIDIAENSVDSMLSFLVFAFGCRINLILLRCFRDLEILISTLGIIRRPDCGR